MDPMQVVQEWQMDLDHMPEGQEQALEQQEVVQKTGRQMGRHKGQEQFDFALEIVGVEDWQSLEEMQPCNSHQMDQREQEGQVHIVVVAGMLLLTSNCYCLVQELPVEPIGCSVEVLESLPNCRQQEQELGGECFQY
jgi:hypothetical protein